MVLLLYNLYYLVHTYRVFRCSGFFVPLYSVSPGLIIVRGIIKVLLSYSLWLMIHHPSWIVFHYYVNYFVFSNSTSLHWTDRQLKTRFKEHALAYKKEKHQFSIAQH
jgi:hypothetical protein